MHSLVENMIETTIHLQDIYCDRCVRIVEESLNRLSPKPCSAKLSLSCQSIRILDKATFPKQALEPAFLGTGFVILDKDRQVILAKEVEEPCIDCRQKSEMSLSRQSSEPSKRRVDGAGRYKITLAVGGMTCAACTRHVSEAITNIPGTDDVTVSLVDNFATCTVETEKSADRVRDALEESGYEATIVNIESSRPSQPEGDQDRRTIALKVDGISSVQYSDKIMPTIGSIGSGVTVKKSLTTRGDPILMVSYVPKPPSFTIRDIVSTIESSNSPPFRVTVHHPPTLEECSKAIQTRERQSILFQLIFAILAAIPTFVIGVVYMSLVGDRNTGKVYLREPIWGGSSSRLEWTLFFVATPVMFYSARSFHWHTVKEVKSLWKRSNSVSLFRRFTRFGSMNLLATSGVTVAYIASLALLILATTRAPSDVMDNTTYFDAVVFLTMFLLMGRFIEITSKSHMADAITALSSLRSSEALLVVPDSFSLIKISVEKVEEGCKELGENGCSMLPGRKIRKVPVDLLEIGDVISVPYGASPSADGTLINGEKGMFDESALTGESRLVSKQSGDKVHVGTINKGRTVHIRVDAIGESTMLETIVKVVREGQTRRAPIERVADVITAYFVPAITFLAIVTWVVWLTLGYSGVLPRDYLDLKVGGWAAWSLRFAIAVFIVACPCGVGLAAPTAFVVGLGVAAKNGILAQGGGEAFQEMSQLDVLVFDKTGTLTEGGTPQVSEFICVAEGKWDEDTIKGVAAELEKASSHPLALAIRQHCSAMSITDFVASSVEEVPGCGLKASFKALHCTAIIGNEKWMNNHGAVPDGTLSEGLDRWKSEGKSIALVSIRDDEQPADQRKFQIVAAFAISDSLRPKATEVVKWFQEQGIETWMITGDNQKTAGAIASLVGIPRENVIAGVLPHEKLESIQQLQQGRIGNLHHKARRNVVAMVGDGINDAPALAAADVGIAIGSGSDVAISSAGFILVSSNLASLMMLRDLSTRVISRVKFNFVWAIAYNLLAVPIAAGVIFPVRHARLSPVWASLTMTLSSCSVVFSSLLLRGYKPKSME